MDDNLIPARAVAPGRLLRRELDARGWSQRDLAEILGRPAQAITEIVRGTKQITPETAVALSKAFGTSAEFWSNLEANYRLALARQVLTEEISRKARLYSWLPFREVTKRGWLRAASSKIDDLERAACAFFGVSEVGAEPRLVVSLRHSVHNDAERSSQRAWVRRVEQLASNQQVGPYSKELLRESITRIVAEARTAEGTGRVPTILQELGVRFVVVPHLPRTRLDGAAAFIPSGPVVALSMRFDRIDYFWFTLLHEMAHLVLEHRGGHLDGETEDDSVDAEEAEANQLAGDWLLSDQDIRQFASMAPGVPSKSALKAFAEEHHVHPGIVAGRLQHLGLVPFSHFRTMLVRVSEHLTPWTDGG